MEEQNPDNVLVKSAHKDTEEEALGCARDGDGVILYENHQNSHFIKLEKGKSMYNRFGKFEHDSIIGKKFGSRIYSSAGWLLLLPFSPERWINAVAHRTQIMYTMDISLVVFRLGLKPGSVVAESGTGSGVLTTAMAKAVSPGGKVFTFEFNADRVGKAREDFAQLALGDVVEVTHRDVCGNGLDVPTTTTTTTTTTTNITDTQFPYDAVFLDLPSPWLVVPSVAANLRVGGVVCFFSPCLEQVHKTYRELVNAGCFAGVSTVESLIRTHEVRKSSTPLTPINPLNKQKPKQTKPTAHTIAMETEATAPHQTEEDTSARPQKRARKADPTPTQSKGGEGFVAGPVCVPHPIMKGHTAFLTFATKTALVKAKGSGIEGEDSDNEQGPADQQTTKE